MIARNINNNHVVCGRSRSYIFDKRIYRNINLIFCSICKCKNEVCSCCLSFWVSNNCARLNNHVLWNVNGSTNICAIFSKMINSSIVRRRLVLYNAIFCSGRNSNLQTSSTLWKSISFYRIDNDINFRRSYIFALCQSIPYRNGINNVVFNSCSSASSIKSFNILCGSSTKTCDCSTEFLAGHCKFNLISARTCTIYSNITSLSAKRINMRSGFKSFNSTIKICITSLSIFNLLFQWSCRGNISETNFLNWTILFYESKSFLWFVPSCINKFTSIRLPRCTCIYFNCRVRFIEPNHSGGRRLWCGASIKF